MAQTITVDIRTINTILERLNKLTQDIETIKKALLKSGPKYGSDEWWEKEIREAKEEFKQGKGIQFHNAKEAIKWLNS